MEVPCFRLLFICFNAKVRQFDQDLSVLSAGYACREMFNIWKPEVPNDPYDESGTEQYREDDDY